MELFENTCKMDHSCIGDVVKGRQYSVYIIQYRSWLTPCPCGSSIAVLPERVGSGRQ